jgi:hypothetical protein
MPLWWEQQLPLQQWQICLCINGDNASLMTSNKDNDINDDNNVIGMKAMRATWGWQQRHCNKGNNTVADQGQQCHCYKGNNASLTMARTLLHQQRQQRHRHEGNNCNRNNGKDACPLMVAMSLQWGQWCQLEDEQLGQQC